MSTEVKSAHDDVAEVPASGSVVTIESPVVPSTIRRGPIRRGRRYQLTAGAAILLVLAAVIGNSVLARQYTPEGAVRQYLAALQSGDAAKAWDVIQVSGPTISPAATLTDRPALQAALATAKPDIKNFTVTATTRMDANTSSVDVTYDNSVGSKQAKFIVRRSGQTHFGLYPVWHLVRPHPGSEC